MVKTEGRYVVVEVNTYTVAPFLQVQFWPDEEHRRERRMVANVPYTYGNRESYAEAMKSATLIAAAPALLAVLTDIAAGSRDGYAPMPTFAQMAEARAAIAAAEAQ